MRRATDQGDGTRPVEEQESGSHRARGGLRLAPPTVRVALAVGLAAIAAAVAATLAHAPLTIARGNENVAGGIASTNLPAPTCQGEEALPRGTSAIRVAMLAALGPRVEVRVSSGSRVLTRGAVPAGWSSGVVTVPVSPVAHTVAPVTVCVDPSSMNGLITLRGWLTRPAAAAVSGGHPLPGRMGLVFLRPSGRSWLARAAAVIGRLDFGHAVGGPWDALLVCALALVLIALSSWLVVREL